MRSLSVIALAAALLPACGPKVRPTPTPPPSDSGEVTLDLTPLTSEQRGRFEAIAGTLKSPCDEAVTLRESLEARACPRATFAARSVARAVADDERDEVIARNHERRYFAPPFAFDLAAAPFQGMPDAPVVLVEFFDYDCPHCAMFAVFLEEILARYPSEARLHYKHFPLAQHLQAVPAAVAALAAGRQGKFLEMHRALFDNQGRHGDADLYGYARAIGLDLSRFDADFRDPATRERVAADRAEGERAGIEGTPSLFVNGRPCEPLALEEIDDRVREALLPAQP